MIAKKEFTKTIRLWVNNYGTVIASDMDFSGSGYTEIAEPITLEFVKLPDSEILKARIAVLDREAEKAKDECATRLHRISVAKQNLLALPASVAHEEEC